ncbi:hypothetical protein SUGI_0662050 [Cryptomeria japonica]|uniref:small glutamine-rich tetratricopeptide repeat-containing protein 2 n=1 Tax=Cryptomeria japonica TaxID=3369 RepID=UPI0024148A4B|nr:small glutamine-rich tetratricopeptide repeat-containing protein 2 [Cryptomeria japonica]GLJ32873.1 hypothetical protein SUGI_0662050 [Cryptomeria japonica]
MAECGAKLRFQLQFSEIRRQKTPVPRHPKDAEQCKRGRAVKASFQSQSSETKKKEQEIRVCVNKACSKSGSRETQQLLMSLAPPHVIVKTCNCLGRCGLGPNLVLLPAEIFVSHCTTAAHAARLLAAQCGASDPENNLIALSLKEQGNKAFECGNAVQAELLYSQAIDLKPSGGQHFLYANRSAARLAIGDNVGSLSDAKEASRIASNWHVAHTRQGDAYYALGEYEAAEHAYSCALAIEPSIHNSKPFKAQIKKLQEKLALSKALS